MLPMIGDKVRVVAMSGICSHYGIYIGAWGPFEYAVVHNAKGGGVEVCGWYDFADGQTVTIVSRVAGPPMARFAVRDRALGLVGLQYDLLAFNCEHAANFAQTGSAVSDTLQVIERLGVLIFVGAVLARA
jgi:hypothetical protein